MSAAHDTQALAEFLTLWAHESRLQTFENRERFRKEAAALASRLQEQEGQPVLSERRRHGEGIGDIIFAVERWKAARTGDASTSALNALEALIVRLAATFAAGSQAVQVPIAYMTTNEEGDPAMLFFDRAEAVGSCADDEEPIPLVAPLRPRPGGGVD